MRSLRLDGGDGLDMNGSELDWIHPVKTEKDWMNDSGGVLEIIVKHCTGVRRRTAAYFSSRYHSFFHLAPSIPRLPELVIPHRC